MALKLDKSLDLQKAGQIKYVTFSFMSHMNAKDIANAVDISDTFLTYWCSVPSKFTFLITFADFAAWESTLRQERRGATLKLWSYTAPCQFISAMAVEG